eukprot:NODE_277_length_1089_cov_856.122115_g223_i0.p1 GENE.NODE_277_length_1089_cov_856.122115_g223_i0~~NODE_277_length_1089_cov_856.122115_g223_i0.p1  ORF type:complete len:337 (-),score=60.76 NODE_277_length_1089_cov_856.122115_g223_i0:48-1058(-)
MGAWGEDDPDLASPRSQASARSPRAGTPQAGSRASPRTTSPKAASPRTSFIAPYLSPRALRKVSPSPKVQPSSVDVDTVESPLPAPSPIPRSPDHAEEVEGEYTEDVASPPMSRTPPRAEAVQNVLGPLHKEISSFRQMLQKSSTIRTAVATRLLAALSDLTTAMNKVEWHVSSRAEMVQELWQLHSMLGTCCHMYRVGPKGGVVGQHFKKCTDSDELWISLDNAAVRSRDAIISYFTDDEKKTVGMTSAVTGDMPKATRRSGSRNSRRSADRSRSRSRSPGEPLDLRPKWINASVALAADTVSRFPKWIPPEKEKTTPSPQPTRRRTDGPPRRWK